MFILATDLIYLPSPAQHQHPVMRRCQYFFDSDGLDLAFVIEVAQRKYLIHLPKRFTWILASQAVKLKKEDDIWVSLEEPPTSLP